MDKEKINEMLKAEKIREMMEAEKEMMETEEVNQPEKVEEQPQGALLNQNDKPQLMALRKSHIMELVNQAKATLEPGIIASVVENIETDPSFWDRVNHLPFSSLFSGKVKVVWGQERENEAPEIAFISKDMVTLLNAITEDVTSLSVFHQTAKMRMTHQAKVIPDYMAIINLLTQLNTLVSVAMNVLIEKQRAAQQQA